MIPSALPTSSVVPIRPQGDPLAVAPAGQLVELVGSWTATVLAMSVARTQRAGEPVAWVLATPEVPHPTDLRSAGVDLGTLAFVRAHRAPTDAARAAEMLLASGSFGLVVVDGTGRLADRCVSRLRALCRRHRARLLVAPAHGEACLGATVTLRLRAERRDGRLDLRWDKDKAGSAPSLPAETVRLPPGASAPRCAPVEALPTERPTRWSPRERVSATA